MKSYLEGCDVLSAPCGAAAATVVGNDWYYSASEIKALVADLKADIVGLQRDIVSHGVFQTDPVLAQGFADFGNEAQRYLASGPVSVLDPTSFGTVGDKLVEYRQRAAEWRTRVAKAAGTTVAKLTPAPAPPAQRRREDPRDEEERRKKEGEWGWKEYGLMGVAVVALAGSVAYVGGTALHAKIASWQR